MAGQDSSLTSSSGSSSEDGQLAAGVAEHANTALRSTSECSQETYKSGVRWQIKAWSNEWSRAWVRGGFGLMIQGSPLRLVGVMTQSPGAQRDKAKHWVGAMLNPSSFFFSPLNVFFFALRLLNELMIFGGFFFSKDPKMFFLRHYWKLLIKSSQQDNWTWSREVTRSQHGHVKRAGRWFLLKSSVSFPRTEGMSCLIIVVQMELEKLQQLWTLHQVLVPVDPLTSECSPPPNWNL